MKLKNSLFIPILNFYFHFSNGIKSSSSLDCQVGMKAQITRHISQEDVNLFGKISGDMNPIHYKGNELLPPIVPGALLNALVSGVIAEKVPGPGSLVVKQYLRFPKSCYVGETVTVVVEVVEVKRLITCKFEVLSLPKNVVVLEGTASLLKKDCN